MTLDARGGFTCGGPSAFHPYECSGPGKCVHCDRASTVEHDPNRCEYCDADRELEQRARDRAEARETDE